MRNRISARELFDQLHERLALRWITPGQLNIVGWRMPPSFADCFERGAKPGPSTFWIHPLSPT